MRSSALQMQHKVWNDRGENAWENSRTRPKTLPFLFIGLLRRFDRHNLKSWLLSLHFPMLTPYRPTGTLEIAFVVSATYAQNKVGLLSCGIPVASR
jgi:hypothetical protein